MVTPRVERRLAAILGGGCGRLLVPLGSFAEYERVMVKERSRPAAQAHARTARRHRRERAIRPSDPAQMARLYAVGEPTVSRILAAYPMLPPDGAATAREHG